MWTWMAITVSTFQKYEVKATKKKQNALIRLNKKEHNSSAAYSDQDVSLPKSLLSSTPQ